MSRLRYACLAMFYVTFAYVTYRDVRQPWTGRPDWPAAELLIHGACGLLLVAACVTDAKARCHPLSDGATLVVCFTFPISMAIYLIWSRGWRGILWLVLNLFVVVVVAVLATVVANTVTSWQITGIHAAAEAQPSQDPASPAKVQRKRPISEL